MNCFFKKSRAWLFCGLALSVGNSYAYDFNGVYNSTSRSGIIKLQISGNQVQDVVAKCSIPDCNLGPAAKTILLNNDTTLVAELKPLGDSQKSIAYTTLVLTPTSKPNQVQAVLVGYRAYFNLTKKDLEYKAEFNSKQILTKAIVK